MTPATVLIDAPQGSAEWHAARLGVCTASRFKDALATLKSGAPSEKCRSYAAEIVWERLTGKSAPCFVTYAMKRGTELEPHARAAYEAKTGNMVLESGIIRTACGRFGYSTDGFIGDDGMIEIKCPESPAVLANLWATKDASDYMDQIQGGLWLTGRQWCDLVIYCPDLLRESAAVFIIRIERDEARIEKMAAGLEAFAATVDALQNQIEENFK